MQQKKLVVKQKSRMKEKWSACTDVACNLALENELEQKQIHNLMISL